MRNYLSNYDIAQEISARLGNEPIPFDSVYSICLLIYQELGGTEQDFDSVYSILLEILPLVDGGISSKVIDDNSISTTKTWSSSKINTELNTKASIEYVDEQIEALAGTANSDIEGKQTEDFTFVQSLPVSGEEDQLVVIKGDNTDSLYKYVSGEWVEQTPDANKLYFDVENEALYSYVTAQHQFAPVSLVNTIVVGSNLNSNADLKALKTPGVYSVVQRLHNATKGDYIKNWTLYVESVDYEEYDKSDSVYQRLVSNYTIQKRTWSATRASNDGWSSFSTYYAGEIKDSTTSKYYTWSSDKLNTQLSGKQDVLTAGQNIDIDASGVISALGYVFNPTSGSIANIYRQDQEDGGALVANVVTGLYGSYAEGYLTTAAGNYGAHAEGELTVASGDYGAHAEGYTTNASGMCDHAEGQQTTASGNNGAHAEGYATTASGMCDHAEGQETTASGGHGAHAEGQYTLAKGLNAHAEGRNTTAGAGTGADDPGHGAHAEGYYTSALGEASHAEGAYTTASAWDAHAEGRNTTASGRYSHSEGYYTSVSGEGAHAEGYYTTAQNRGEHTDGNYNISHTVQNASYGNAGNTLHSVGDGADGNNRNNAFEIMQNADMYIKGIGGYDGIHIKGEISGTTVYTVQDVINAKQDELIAGTNIEISGTTISATYKVATNAEVDMLFVQQTTIE